MNPKGVIATTIRSVNDVGSEGAAVLAGAILDDLANAGYEVRDAAGSEARERLARHLYATALPRMLRRSGEIEWDEGETKPEVVEDCRRRADELLAVIAGKETN